jgi:site-specific DNA recombinase
MTATLTRTPTRPAIYCRISLDRAGAGVGVERQLDACTRYAETLGWPGCRVYTDNDQSAYSGKPRPGYERMVADIETGEIDGVLCWHTDRLTRTPTELESLILLAKRRGLILEAVENSVDLHTASGVLTARISTVVARHESEHAAERQRERILQGARKGKQLSGSRRPYGYAPNYFVISGEGERVRRRITDVAIDPAEAEIIRECARRVLAGEAISSVARDLNRRGIPTSEGNAWNRLTLRRMLCSARISGRREHIRRDTYGTSRPLIGEIVSTTSEWPTIISPADSDKLRALLADPSRCKTPGPARRHLLSGILRCGRCEAHHPMVARDTRYVCNLNAPRGGCGLSIIKSATDECVSGVVLRRLANPEMVRLLLSQGDDTDALYAQIEADEAKLAVWTQRELNGVVTATAFDQAASVLTSRIKAARRALKERMVTNPLEDFVGPHEEMQARWEAMNVEQRRAVLNSTLVAVTVTPARNFGCNRFDMERLQPLYRDRAA